MRPSEIRTLMLFEHDAILEQVAALSGSVGAKRGTEEAVALASQLDQLANDLERHIDDEERLLLPVLAEAGNFRPEDRQTLLAHHRRLREDLGWFRERAARGEVSGAAFRSRLDSLLTDIRLDVERENSYIIVPQNLSDYGYSDGEGS